MAHFHVYQGAVTAGDTNGTQVSEDTELSPISVGPLNATDNDVSDPIKLAIRCESGYATTGNTTIMPTGTSAAKWALAPDDSGSAGIFEDYGDPLTITDAITAVNKLFWVKARATSDEPDPINDTSVDLVVAATIAAV
jgi:hypothetical protein